MTARLLWLCLLALSFPACTALPGERPRTGDLEARADVGRVVAAELAFARAAQDVGQWTAFAKFAAADAVVFVPEPVSARAWLRGRTNPPEAVRWQPHEVWSSCDGSLAVTRGAWQRPDGSVGYFTTAWQRQDDGEYRWVMDQGNELAQALSPPEMIGGQVADCRDTATRDRDAMVQGPQCDESGCRGGGEAADGTLRYRYQVQPDGARTVTVSLLRDGSEVEVLRSDVAAQ